ncbi:MAG: hypothetical protein HRU05_20450 [Oceanospirillaceae bacterium]|nr:hypothetical protein [Oceanospirillaceae bacterium]
MSRKSPVRRTSAQWHQIIEDQKSSDLTISQFCTSNGVALSNFYQWRSKLGNQVKESQASQTKEAASSEDWVALTPPPSTVDTSSWDMELNLPNGVTLKMRSQ